MDRHRQVATGELVLTLRSGLDAGKPVRDGPVDGLMVAELEMQAGMILDAAPIAPEKRVAADEIERPAIGRPSRSASTSRMSSRIVA